MQIEVKGRHMTISDDLREHVEKRFAKVGKQVSELATLEVELSEERNPAIPDCDRRRGDAPGQGHDAARAATRPATWPTRSTSARTSSPSRSSATATSGASEGSRARPHAAAGHGAGRPPGGGHQRGD